MGTVSNVYVNACLHVHTGQSNEDMKVIRSDLYHQCVVPSLGGRTGLKTAELDAQPWNVEHRTKRT